MLCIVMGCPNEGHPDSGGVLCLPCFAWLSQRNIADSRAVQSQACRNEPEEMPEDCGVPTSPEELERFAELAAKRIDREIMADAELKVGQLLWLDLGEMGMSELEIVDFCEDGIINAVHRHTRKDVKLTKEILEMNGIGGK